MRAPIEVEGNPTPMEMALIGSCLVILCRHYPGYQWGVEIKGGMLFIRNRDLLIPAAYEMPVLGFSEKKLIMAGGEILERHGLPRRKMDVDRVLDLPTNVKGHTIADMS